MQLTDVFPVAVRRPKIVANDPYTADPLKKTNSELCDFSRGKFSSQVSTLSPISDIKSPQLQFLQ